MTPDMEPYKGEPVEKHPDFQRQVQAEKEKAQVQVHPFEVLKVMSDRDMDVSMAQLGTSLKGAKYIKSANETEIIIRFPGNVVGKILTRELIGGLVLSDKNQFHAVKEEMERG